MNEFKYIVAGTCYSNFQSEKMDNCIPLFLLNTI